jgi:hypothetical protein
MFYISGDVTLAIPNAIGMIGARHELALTAKRRGYVLTAHLFLDDSGKEGQATTPIVCLAGYLAHDDVIASLNEKWIQLLIKYGIPEIHMKSLVPMTGIYKDVGWSDEQRDAVVAEFIEVINSTNMVGVGIAVNTAAWRKYKGKYPKINVGNIQQFCLNRAVSRVIARLHEVGVDDHLSLVFDTDPEFGVARFNTFCALMRYDTRANRRLMAITFGHPMFFPGLQAADLLAWETRKELARDGRFEPTRRWKAMFTRMPDYRLEYVISELWEEEHFEKAMPEITETFAKSA